MKDSDFENSVVEEMFDLVEHRDLVFCRGTVNFFERWLGGAVAAVRSRDISIDMDHLFAKSCAGIGFDGDDRVGAFGSYDDEWMPERFIPRFKDGDLYVVGDVCLGRTYFPQRIYSRLEFAGWIHRSLQLAAQQYSLDVDFIRNVESKYYHIADVEGLVERKLSGQVDWDYSYPIGNLPMMQLLGATFSNFDYGNRTLRTRALSREWNQVDLSDAKVFAADLLRVEASTFEGSAKEFPEIEAYYLWENIRGGRALVIGYDGSVLLANSSVRPTDHRQAFVDGRRTPLEQFE